MVDRAITISRPAIITSACIAKKKKNLQLIAERGVTIFIFLIWNVMELCKFK